MRSCFPKDIKALIEVGKSNNINMDLCSSVDKVNIDQREIFSIKLKVILSL